MNNFFLATLLLVLPNLLQAAAIYKWTDKAGNVHYSDTPQTRSVEKVDIKPGPDAEKIEPAKQRATILRKAAEDLQSNREQREAKREKQKQQRKKERQAQAEEKKKAPREGHSEGHYQKQWQQQLPPRHPHPAHPDAEAK